jgi:hypothetical protein
MFSDITRLQCSRFFKVSANISVSIFKVNIFEGFWKFYIDMAVSDEWEVEA